MDKELTEESINQAMQEIGFTGEHFSMGLITKEEEARLRRNLGNFAFDGLGDKIYKLPGGGYTGQGGWDLFIEALQKRLTEEFNITIDKSWLPPSLDDRIKAAYKAVEEMDKRDKTGLSFVDIMKPKQWLHNLLIIKQQQDMENKYFTPSIEDIRVGYECELEDLTVLGEKWDKTILTDMDVEIIYTTGIQYVRVPYLTKEQIEAEGWIYTPYVGTNVPNRFIKGGLTIEYDFTTILLQIEHPSDYNEQGCSPVYIYNGQCKDINTFRYICKLLNIKQ